MFVLNTSANTMIDMSMQSDYLSWIIPSILAAIISFIIVALNRFSKTSDSTITGTIEIKGLQENLSNLRKDMERSFEKVEKSLDDKDDNLRLQIDKIRDKLSSMSGETELNKFRIQQLEDKVNKIGGAKSAV